MTALILFRTMILIDKLKKMRSRKFIINLIPIIVFIIGESCSNPELIKETRADGKIYYYYILNGVKQGESKLYDSSGNLISIVPYIDGKREGRAIVYHENGKMSRIENFRGDIRIDSAFSFHLNGKIKLRRFYVNGKESGKFRLYDSIGRLIQVRNFVPIQDTVRSDQNWDYDTLGKLIPELSYYYELDFFQMATKVAKRDEYFAFNDTLQYGDTLGIRVRFHRNYIIRQSLMAIDTSGNDRYDIDIHTYNGFLYKMKDSVSIAVHRKYKLGNNTFRAVVFDIDTAGFVHPFYLKKDFVVVPKK